MAKWKMGKFFWWVLKSGITGAISGGLQAGGKTYEHENMNYWWGNDVVEGNTPFTFFNFWESEIGGEEIYYIPGRDYIKIFYNDGPFCWYKTSNTVFYNEYGFEIPSTEMIENSVCPDGFVGPPCGDFYDVIPYQERFWYRHFKVTEYYGKNSLNIENIRGALMDKKHFILVYKTGVDKSHQVILNACRGFSDYSFKLYALDPNHLGFTTIGYRKFLEMVENGAVGYALEGIR